MVKINYKKFYEEMNNFVDNSEICQIIIKNSNKIEEYLKKKQI